MLCWHRHTLLSDSGGNLYNSKSTPISPTYIGECQFTLVVGLKYIPHPVNLFFNLTVCHFLAGNIQETSADYFTVLSEWLLLWRSNDKRPISLYVRSIPYFCQELLWAGETVYCGDALVME